MRRSVGEAREAMTVASGDSGADTVQHIDELGMRRMLFGWYSSRRASELADALLEPLFAADPAGELAQTLECYLDHESSATRVAELLTLHRNTVNKRIERIRAILAVDLEDPDNRLALQLAFRVERGGIAQEAEQLA
jgi:DNA-binding PucR family transcriptional regulator